MTHSQRNLPRLFAFLAAIACALTVCAAGAFAQSPAHYQGNGWWAKAAVYHQLDDTFSMWGKVANQSDPNDRDLLCMSHDPTTGLYSGASFQIDNVSTGQTRTVQSNDMWFDWQVGLGGSDYRIVCFDDTRPPFDHPILDGVPVLPVAREMGATQSTDPRSGKIRVTVAVGYRSQGVGQAMFKVTGGGVDQILGSQNPGNTSYYTFTATRLNAVYTLHGKTTDGWKVIDSFVPIQSCDESNPCPW